MTARARHAWIAAALASFAILAAPAVAGAAPPAGVTGMALDSRVELAWQPAAGATGYKVYRGTSATTVTTPLMASPLTPPDLNVPVSFTDITPVNGTTYYYAVRAVIGGVESANSRVVRATPRPRSCTGAGVVTRENCFPGDPSWNVSPFPGVDGFATAQSIDHGESVDLKIQASGASAVDLEIFRSGDYGGAGARLFSAVPDVPVTTQPACVNDPAVGLLDCSNWSATYTLTTTAEWPSGVYLIRVSRKDTGRETHILLVVRDDDRDADVLFGVPVSTYQAYNAWGGKSLYDNKSGGGNTVSGTPRAVKVSYDRPYGQPQDDGQYDWYTRSDIATVRWLERSGYDVSYSPVEDFERHPERLLTHRMFISGAHDEYWSGAMRSALEQARDRGIDLFFTGANEIYWKVRFEPSPVSARQDRVLVSYKSTQSGGADPSGIPTGTWRDPAGANRPENALAGGMYIGEHTQDFYPLKVSAQEGHDRIWRYTGLDTQPTGATATVGSELVGWEWDARVANGQQPAGLTTLATSPVSGRVLQDAGSVYVIGPAISHMTKYTWPSGGLVVSSGTNHWNWGLALTGDGLGEPDRRIRQATTNILIDMGAVPETPASDIVLDDPSAPPLVTARNPGANATNVDPHTTVRATFSRPMDPASITSASFSLRRPDGTPVAATVSYDSVTFTATLTPSSDLPLETTYTARLEPTVRAANGIGLGGSVTWSFMTRPPDRTAPAVSITAPANGATVIAGVDVKANAADDTAVAGVQFKLDGADLGPEDTTAPYAYTWDARAVPAGAHQLTAVARDTSGNAATSATVNVTVDPTGLVGAYGFEEAAGTQAVDSSGKGNPGTLSGAARSTAGRHGKALSFDGVNDWVSVADAASLDLSNAMTLEAWVRPTTVAGWQTALMKEQATGLAYGIYSNTSTNRPSAHVYTSSEDDTRGTAQVAANAWTHLAATYDGATLRLYVGGTLVSSKAIAGSMIATSGALRIGGNGVWGEWFSGLIDEIRVYRRVLSAAELQSDMGTPVAPSGIDGQAPTAPGGLAATGGVGEVRLTWTAATDNVGVDHYNVHRGTSAGFTPSAANRIAQPSALGYTDSGLAAGTYYYRVTAEDAATNVGPPSAQASAAATADTAAPTVSITAPAAGTTVAGQVDLGATAADNVGVAGVQFRVDGADAGAEDTSAPYTRVWDSTSLPNGSHTITAVARDAAGNSTTSAPVSVTVQNAPPDTSGLVAAYGFEEASGATATDSSTSANSGTLSGPTRSATGKFGKALSFDGVNDWVAVPDASSLDLTTAMTLEAWVRPTVASGWQTVLMKEQAAGLAYGMYSNTNGNRPSAHVYTTAEDDTRGTAQVAANAWTHVAATYDGATLRLYVNGTLASSKAIGGSIVATSGALHIGGNGVWGEWFGGLIDEVRVYRRVLSAGEVQTDMNRAVVPAVVDGQAPTAPGGLTATGAIGEARLTWSAANDNVGVDHYNVHRGTSAGFTPSAANRIAQPSALGYTDGGLAAGTYYYRVTAEDAAANVGPPSAEASAVATADTTPPTASITAPAAGATVSGTVDLNATATDNVGVAGVQFRVDGANSGAEDTAAPYTRSWDSSSVPNGSHTITAVARDAAGNSTTSAPVSVTVQNAPPDTSGLVGAYGFEETSGTIAGDSSTAANPGTLSGPTRAATGRFGRALSFDGADDWVTIPDAGTLDLTTAMTIEAWVNPSVVSGWRTVLMKEQSGDLAYALYANTSTNRPSGHVYAGSERDTRGTAQLAAGIWTHLAATYDGATLRLYVNGVQASSTAVSGAIAASTGALRIGGNNVWPEWFAGLIDEVRVYRRALSATEIQGDMNRAVVP